MKPNVNLKQRFGAQLTSNELLMDKVNSMLRVAIPGIITSFNYIEQTATVKPVIMEKVTNGMTGEVADVELPELLDVPIVFPRSGGFSLTMPVVAGDECLVVFADMCIDAWWASGGIQKQEELRRHDLSDAFAILGTWSQAKKVPAFSNANAKLVHESTGNGVEVSSTGVVFKGGASVGGKSFKQYVEDVVHDYVINGNLDTYIDGLIDSKVSAAIQAHLLDKH